MKNRMKVLLSVLLLCSLPLAAQVEQDSVPRLNKKNLVIKEWNTSARSKTQQLDHETIYNPDGRKIEETEYNTDGVKWRKRFEYNTAGKVAKEYTYDRRGRLQTYKTIEYNEFGRKKSQNTYDAKGKLLTVKVFEYIAQDAS